ncbi:MAG: hypothetical protein ETSY2_20760 [Candidatus Entotheonella gemina]|uniref:Uncharacterized protein n=1 Tax=Candidatus Entotheonella gemina TaxID=1429439 RepID=W4M7E2_9BACT|nr:MAG: hypothetical protein ETSY2_20760 [Candidatus Entotheonella gemina]
MLDSYEKFNSEETDLIDLHALHIALDVRAVYDAHHHGSIFYCHQATIIR